MKTDITAGNDPRKYVGYDLYGHPYNVKYPPNRNLYGSAHEGYKTTAEGVLFYDFAVLGYDVRFSYRGKTYRLRYDDNTALISSPDSNIIKTFESPIDLIEKLKINDHRLIDIIRQLEDVEPV